MTELHLAARWACPEICARLLDEGASVNSYLDIYYTPLIAAARGGKIDNVRLLLRRGADVNAEGCSGETALFHAALAERPDIMDILLKNGADIEHKEKIGLTTLSVASGSGWLTVVRFLLEKHADVDTTCEEGKTPLHYAIQRDNLEAMRLLLEHGAPVHVEDSEGLFPLHQATLCQDISATELLLANGAHIDACGDRIACPPLCYAVRCQREEIVRFLLDSGAAVSCDYHATVVHVAAAASAEMVHILLRYISRQSDGGRAILNRTDEARYTPLHVAVGADDIEAVLALVNAGAEMNITNDRGQTPLALSIYHGTEQIGRLLRRRGGRATFRPSWRRVHLEPVDGSENAFFCGVELNDGSEHVFTCRLARDQEEALSEDDEFWTSSLGI